ncbi:MAG: hypothetical protein IH936_09780 [Acidobacteria bacterium]|nr:hypothetical protein [Acidobacteriota bacterium]
MSAFRSEIDQLRAAKVRLESEAEVRAASDSEAGRRIKWLEEAIASTEAERSHLEQTTLELRGEVDQLRDMNEWLALVAAERGGPESMEPGRLQDLEGALASAGAEAEVRGAEIAVLETKIAALENEVLAEKSGSEDLDARLEAAEKFLAESEGRRAENDRRLEVLRLENQSLRERAEPEQPEVAVSAELTESVEFNQSVKVQVQLGAAPLAAMSVLAREATAIVEAWARAWSEQRVEDYLSFYSSTFEPAAELSLGEWESQRKKRVSEPARIEVLVAMADLRTLDKDRVEVVFLQSYESDLMADVVVKTLLLVREDGNLKIDAERASSPWES